MQLYPLFSILWLSLGLASTTTIHGFVVGKNNARISGATVFSYRFIDQEAVTVGSSHPLGAGFFSPPGSEKEGRYFFDVHLPNNSGTRQVGPIALTVSSSSIFVPTDGRPPYYENTPENFLPTEGSKLYGVGTCGAEETWETDESNPDLVRGYVVSQQNTGIAGAKVYPYRNIGGHSVSVGNHPTYGAGYFSPPGDEQTGWYLFDVHLPNGGGHTVTKPIYIDASSKTLVLPTDGRDPFFGKP